MQLVCEFQVPGTLRLNILETWNTPSKRAFLKGCFMSRVYLHGESQALGIHRQGAFVPILSKNNLTYLKNWKASPAGATKVGVQNGQKISGSAVAPAPRRLNWRPGKFDQLGPTDTYQWWSEAFQNLNFPKIWVPMTFFVKTPFFDFWRAVLILKALPRQWVGKISWFFNTRLISHVKLTVPIFINKYQLVGEQWDREFRGQKSVFLR